MAAEYVIRSQYGDDSIALVQWAYENKMHQVQVVYVDTGFAAESWKERILLGEEHAKRCGFSTLRIISPISFEDAVRGRSEFPSPKFQWCSALLKGLPFLDWLDTWDPTCKAIIMMAKRKDAAFAHSTLTEWIKSCEFHNHRMVWHPILEIDEDDRNALLTRAGFQPLNHRSLECEPCVNSSLEDLARLDSKDYQKIKKLEEDLSLSLFSEVISIEIKKALENRKPTESKNTGSELKKTLKTKQAIEITDDNRTKEKYLDLFYRGCGNPYGCGL